MGHYEKREYESRYAALLARVDALIAEQKQLREQCDDAIASVFELQARLAFVTGERDAMRLRLRDQKDCGHD